MKKNGFAGAMFCAVAIAATHANADDLLRLYGIDARDAQVFAIDDLRNPQGTFTDYGRLHVAGDAAAGRPLTPVTGDIRALTVVNTFDAYAVVNDDIAGFRGPVLLHFDLRNIDNGGPVTAEPIGTIPGVEADLGWRVTGVAGDPLFNVMHVLLADGDPTTTDRVARVRNTIDRGPQTEHVAEIRWRAGGVRMGGDIAMGPAGLLLVADEAEGRVVMIEPSSGEVRGVRIDGIRVDTDAAQYGGIAWDGYNDRTALFDRATGQLVVTNRRDNSTASFDLRQTGVDDAEGLEFVFRPDPPGEEGGAASSHVHTVSNVRNRDRYGSNSGVSPTPGGGGGNNAPFDIRDLFDDLEDPPETDDPADPEDPATDDGGGGGEDPYEDPGDDAFDGDPPGGGGGGGDPTDPPGGGGGDGGGPIIPAPGAAVVLGLGMGLVARRRR